MIEKLNTKYIHVESDSTAKLELANKINELVDAVNAIQKEREAERFEIQEWIGILEAVRKSVNKLETMAKNTNTVLESLVQENNIHEKQIDELQMKAEPEKCEAPTDPYAEQRKWIGKLCRFWDGKEEEKVFGILTTIDSDCGLSDMCPYWNDTTKNWFEHCEPVKDDIIYKGGDNDDR